MNYYWIIVLAVTTAVFGTLLLHRFHRSPETEATAQRLVAAMTIVTALIYGVLGFFKLEALQMGLWDFGIYDSMLHLAATGQGWMQDFRGGAFGRIGVPLPFRHCVSDARGEKKTVGAEEGRGRA